MTLKECKRRLDGLSLYLTIAKNRFEIPSCVDRAAVKLVENLIDSVKRAYDSAVMLGRSRVYGVRKPLNRARFEIGRIIKEYERREEKAAKELFRLALRLGGKK